MMLQQALDKFAGQTLIRDRYDNYIGGQWTAPAKGQYFDNISPVTGQVVCQVARGTAEDIEAALDAAHAAKDAWGKMSSTERSNILLKMADRMEANLDLIAAAPALYEALQRLLIAVDADNRVKRGDYSAERNAARAALKLARGDA